MAAAAAAPALLRSRRRWRHRVRCIAKPTVDGAATSLESSPASPPITGGFHDRVDEFLWNRWRALSYPRPPPKEVEESLAFFRATHKLVGEKALLVDVAGGHGGVALAFRAHGRVERAVVLDVYQPTSFENLRAAWLQDGGGSPRGANSPKASDVEFMLGDLREAQWLEHILRQEAVQPSDVAVVACHACSVLSDGIIRACLAAGVDFAVMPCCHGEDGPRGDRIKHATRSLGVALPVLTDVMRLGVIDASPGYSARLRTIDAGITPENRILVGTRNTEYDRLLQAKVRAQGLEKLTRKYSRRVERTISLPSKRLWRQAAHAL